MKESISSKKLWFTVFAVAVSFAFAWLASERYPNMEHMYSRFVDLVEFCVAGYVVGNVANKYVLGKAAPAVKHLVAKPDPKPVDPLDKEIPSP